MKIYLFICCAILQLNCNTDKLVLEETENMQEMVTEIPDEIIVVEENTPNPQENYKILSLGDSYTIGQSVCETCRFPEQLKANLTTNFNNKKSFDLKIIAKTGWTTTNLKNAINTEKPTNDYDLVTLLIGVNNQYQNKPFDLYKTEFPQLLNTAISLAKGNSKNVIVISIPDYAHTPFGRSSSNPETISKELDTYNRFAEAVSKEKNITYINITDITRKGLENPSLVASDGLHPSELAYSKFVERILPIAIQKLND